jgi:cyclopropane-fatty-acyl-phospholipid synthase
VWHHYDIGNHFYKLWLDEQLLYTCAYFPDPSMTLEEAQIAKMDHVCRKLELRPGQQVLEAGCGWGAFALHMARHYDVRVKAFNVSREQIAYARQEALRQGLSDQVEFVEADWRAMDEPCDVFVSVGMLEHVGLRNYQTLGNVIDRCLKPDGRGLLHTIGQNQSLPVNSWIARRIFPGGYPPTLSEMMGILEPNRFSVLDAENLRLHYAETLRHWLERFEDNAETVRDMFDDQFVRMWRLYLCGSLAAFESGELQLFQVLFNRGTSNHVPRTRAAIYASLHDAAEPSRRVPR